ncbi:MAG: peptidyl-prolyl cis-trans isomerase [Pseudomonadota bacterium]
MKTANVAGLLLAALLVSAPAAANDDVTAKPQAPKVLARVGDVNITEDQVNEILDGTSPADRPPDVKRQILDKMVELFVLANEAEKAGMEKDPQVQRQLLQARTVILARGVHERMAADVKISEEDARRDYEKNLDKFSVPAQFRLRHIQVKTKAKAEAILARLKKGESFENIAKKESQDSSTAQRGGDMGWQISGRMESAFERVATGLKAGEVSKGPLRTPMGYHVIKLTDIQEAHKMAFEEVKGYIMDSLQKQEMERLRKELVKKADVEIFLVDEPAAQPAEPSEAQPVESQDGQPKKDGAEGQPREAPKDQPSGPQGDPTAPKAGQPAG